MVSTRQHSGSGQNEYVLVHRPKSIIDATRRIPPPNTRTLGPLASKTGPIGFPQKNVRKSDRLKIHPIWPGLYPLSWCVLKYSWNTAVVLMTPKTAKLPQKEPAVTDQARAPPSGKSSLPSSFVFDLSEVNSRCSSRPCSVFSFRDIGSPAGPSGLLKAELSTRWAESSMGISTACWWIRQLSSAFFLSLVIR